ncbi:hypothetical protein VZG28_05025 [Synechococcus elongatus IITB4]|uniref:hypothetical protein n=1 Tax=Synechococcus elongatus TaxID=32046 RepID=UPI0030D3A5AF
MSYLDQFQTFQSQSINGGSIFNPDFTSDYAKSRNALVNFRPDRAAEAAGLASGKDGQDFRNALATQFAGNLQSFYDDEARDYRTAAIERDRFLLQATTNLRSQRELNADAFNYGVQSTLIGQSLDFGRDQLQGAIQLAGVQEQGRQNRLQSNADALNLQNTARVQGFENRLADAQAQTAQLRFIGAQGNEQRLGLAEEGFQQRLGINEQGFQDRLQTAQQGFEQRQGIAQQGFEDRSLAAQQGFEQRRGIVQQGFEDRLLSAQQGLEQRRGITQQGFEDRLSLEEQGFQQRLGIAQQGFEQRRGIAAEGFEQRLGLNEQARLGDQSKDLDGNRSRSLAMRWGGNVDKVQPDYRATPVFDYGSSSEVSRFQDDVRGITRETERSDVQGISEAGARSSVQSRSSVASRSDVEGRTAATARTSTVGNQNYGTVEARRSSLSDVQLADNSGAGRTSAEERAAVDSWNEASRRSVEEGLRRAGASGSSSSPRPGYGDRFDSAARSSSGSSPTRSSGANSTPSGGSGSGYVPSAEDLARSKARRNAAAASTKAFAARNQA